MDEWVEHADRKIPSLKNPIILVGLPGIGNVGKIVADFLIEEFKAKKLIHYTSPSFPHCVFVNEQNLVELPSICIYHAPQKKRDLLFIAGDIQPIDERACYQFCDRVLTFLSKHPGSEIITLGGIGLHDVPKQPKVFCTGSNKEHVAQFAKGTRFESDLYGVVGPIIGVSGVLLGLARDHNIPSVGLLAETYGHPMYLGVSGAREILSILQKKLGLKINIAELEKEIKEIEVEVLKRSRDLERVSKQAAMHRMPDEMQEMDYIG